jgi:hypothetical protein
MARRKLTTATEQLLLLIQAKCPGADHAAALELAEASALSEIQASAEQMLRRLGRGEGRHFHLGAPGTSDVLTRSAVAAIIRSEAGM